jgi:hypothetical protein
MPPVADVDRPAGGGLPVIERVRQILLMPPMTVAQYADSLARSSPPQTAELVRHLLPSAS